ncbi:MAG: Ig-like domain-containing protein [Anaerolineae bacterium]
MRFKQTPKSQLVNLVFLVLLVVGPLLSACAQPTATLPAPRDATPQPISSPIPLKLTPPVVTPEATAVPLPPTVVAVQPERGEEQPLDASVRITFDQAMDPTATQTSFQIMPEAPGSTEVMGNTLVWTPGKSLARATRYDITVAGAKSSAGLAMNQPVQFRFVTVGYLEVTSTNPANGAQDIATDTGITLVFNRPVVSLTSVDQQKDLPQPLTFTPAIKGSGRWINTSVYSFKSDLPLLAATTYSVSVTSALTDTTGGVLAEPFAWSFTTTNPMVQQVTPEANANAILPSQTFSITFSQPMDQASTQTAFSLVSKQGAATGKFTWTENSRELNFKPDSALTFGAVYTLTVTTDAQAFGGIGALRSPVIASYRVIALPAILKTEPQNGETNLNPVGAVQIYFTGAISEATVANAVTITPILTTTQVVTYFNSYENRLFVTWPWEARTAYTVTLKGTVGDNYGHTLGSNLVLTFTTGDFNPFVQLNVAGPVGTYNAYTRTVASILHRNISNVDFALYKLSETQFLRLTGENSWETQRTARQDKKDLLRQWRVQPPSERNRSQVWFEPLVLDGNQPLAPGLYYLVVTSPEAPVKPPADGQSPEAPGQIIAVSRYNVFIKSSPRDSLVWVTDLKTGQPVGEAPVRLLDEKGLSKSGVTNADGVYTATLETRDVYRPLLALVGQPGQDNFGVANTRWTDGIDLWNFGLNGLYGETYVAPYTAYLYTDRPIYRPGQTVYFKGIIRLDNDARYRLPDLKQVPIVITDQNGNEVFRRTLALNPLGTFDGELKLADEAGLGYYSVNAQLSPDFGSSTAFQVAEYRKPEYEMSVSAGQPEYRQGDTITVTAQASYFFGGAVKDASVRWTLFSADAYFDYKGADNYSFSDITTWERLQNSGPYGERIAEGAGQTDAQGRFVISVPAQNPKAKQSQRFTFEIALMDLNNQEVSGSTSVVVHLADFYIGVMPADYVGLAGKAMDVNLITVDPDSQPVPSVPLTVTVAKAEWFSVQERDDSGRFFWTSKVKETPAFTATVTTGPDGKAIASWKPAQGGQYLVRAAAVDARGRPVRSAAFLWVSGSPNEYVSWRRENNDRLELILDKQSYQPGDVARVLVPSPFEGEALALLTVERGRTYTHQLLTLTSNSTTVEVPIEPIFAPNVFISVMLVKGQDASDASNELAQFRLGYSPLVPVSTGQQQIKLSIIPSATNLGPRDTVSFTVQALDYLSKPVQAEVSLALVDKAVLALADPMAPPLLEAFYRQRGLGVLTAATLVLNIDRINQQQARGTKGGGGGGGDGGLMLVRSEFPDIALWRADVMTGADGTATVSVRLPDNLTTWRMVAKAVSADTAVGEGLADVRVSRPLLVRPVLPRFFVAGDQAEIAVIVTNNTDEAQKTDVSLSAQGLELGAAPQQTVDVPAQGVIKLRWPVTVQPGDEVTIKFTALAATLNDAVQIKLPVYRYTTSEVVGTSGQVDQGVGRLESIMLPPNAIKDQGELLLKLEPSLAAGMQSGLNFLEHYQYECTEQTLSRFLPNVMTYRALKQLGIDRPELAKALPSQVAVGLQRLYNRQNVDGGWGWWTAEESNPFVSGYVVFGLVQARQAGIAVDSTVLERGLRFVERQLKAPKDLAGYETNQQAFLLYVLAEGGRGSVGRTVALFEARERLANYGKAYLALALSALDTAQSAGTPPTPAPLFTTTVTVTVPTVQPTPAGQNPDAPANTPAPTALPEPTAAVTSSLRALAATLLDDLRGAAIESATGAHWQETNVDYWTMNTDIRSTAIILSTFARLRPEDAIGPNAVRWLMTVRKAGAWETTQETVWSILALTDWMVASGELKGNYSYRVAFNGESLAEGAVSPQTVDQAVTLRRDVTEMFNDRANALTFERYTSGEQTGEGRLYYSAHLRYFLPVEQIQARDRGISIHREYRLENCGQKDAETCPLISAANVGDVIAVKLTLVVPNDLHYVVIENPLPAGAEAVDTSLKTTRPSAQGPELQPEESSDGWYFWLPSHSELRDEKVALFATYLPRGTYTYRYQMRASLPGRFLTLPATGYEMYFPDVWGRSDGSVFEVKQQ